MRKIPVLSAFLILTALSHSAIARSSETTVTGIPLAIIAVLGFALLTFEITSIILAGRKNRMNTAAVRSSVNNQRTKPPVGSAPTAFQNASEELKTSLNNIQDCSSHLLREELTDSQREYVEVIEASTRTLLNTVNSLLDQSLANSASVPSSSVPQASPSHKTPA